MLDFNIIEELRKPLMTQQEFCDKLKMSTVGYQRMIRRGDMKLSTLYRIADVLNIDVGYFFSSKEKELKYVQNEVLDPKQTYGIKNENEILKDRIKDLEKIISLLEKEIETLKISSQRDNNSYDIETDAVLKKNYCTKKVKS